jgi:hypothetical protein
MSLERFYEGIEWSEIMKEINYTCAHMDFNKSYGCAKCEEERKMEMDKGTISPAAKELRKG